MSGGDQVDRKRLQTLFGQAIELDEQARRRFLDEQCGDDAALRAELDQLIDHDRRRPEDFLGRPAVDLTAPADELRPGDVVADRYRIEDVLGVGGMGVVYRAEQTSPVRRPVALKVIKLGMDTRAVIARFEAERQTLAVMSHSGIAKVLDAGVTRGGRPFFVMERVSGAPIDVHCDDERLTTEQRLRLFTHVCEAIHHAHQKGIIHRDIKPSNILVAIEDGRAVPKVIDFGVAKATAQLTEESMLATVQGQLVGTPQYMSPEQASLAHDIDTRSDIYSLGVLLYQLLTGTPPFGGDSPSSSLDDIRRRIVQDQPPRPSTRVDGERTASGDPETTSVDIAGRRRTEPRALARSLRGDLDWIVMKAMDKDRTRRYGTALDLASDVRRHLRHEPVEAGPPSVTYTFSRLLRRHRALAAGVIAVLIVLIGAAAVSTVFAVREAQARREADERRVAAEEQREAARRAGRIAEETNEFLVEMLRASDPRMGASAGEIARDLRVVDVLDRAADGLDDRVVSDPVVEAGIRGTLGQTYLNLGDLEAAEPQLRRSRALMLEHLGPDDKQTLYMTNTLAVLCSRLGRHDEARSLAADALERRRRVQGATDVDTLTAMTDLAGMHRQSQQFDEAERLYLEALEGLRQSVGEEDLNTMVCMNGLAILYQELGRFEEAEPLAARSLELLRATYGDEYLDTIDFMSALGSIYVALRRYDEAEPLLLESLTLRRRVVGDDHPRSLSTMNTLAGLYRRQGRVSEAEALYEQIVEGSDRVLGAAHPTTLSYLNNYAVLLRGEQRYDEAEPLFLRALAGSRATRGDTDSSTLISCGNLARLYIETERFDEAEPLALEAMRGLTGLFGEEHPTGQTSIRILVDLYEAWGRTDEADRFRARLAD